MKIKLKMGTRSLPMPIKAGDLVKRIGSIPWGNTGVWEDLAGIEMGDIVRVEGKFTGGDGTIWLRLENVVHSCLAKNFTLVDK